MRNTLIVAVRFTLITTILLGIAYPLAITAFAHFTMPSQANGQLISHNGSIIGSRIKLRYAACVSMPDEDGCDLLRRIGHLANSG